MAFFRRPAKENRLLLDYASAFTPAFSADDEGGTWSGEYVGPDNAMRLGAVWACVRLITETISTLPVDTFDAQTREPVPTPSLLHSPAAGLGLHDWLSQVVVSLLLRGNAYGLVVARDGLVPSQVEVLSPDLVSVGISSSGRIEYRYRGDLMPTDDVWHVKGLTLPGKVIGLSPVAYARQTIGLGLAAEHYGARWFGESGQPQGVLKSGAQLTADQASTLQGSWAAARRSSKVAVLSGDLTFDAISVAPAESQFIESRRLTVADVARIFGVPPEMIGGEAGGALTYANVEQRSLDFLTYSVGPWIARIEGALNLLLGGSQYVKLNTGALIRTDLKTRYDSYAVALTNGFLTVDEVRALEDRPPLPQASEAVA